MVTKTEKSFTLMELVITGIIVSVLATIAITGYLRTTNRAYLDDAIRQLTLIHGANQAYKSKTWKNWPYDGATHANVTDINDNLFGTGSGILNNSTFNFSCTGSNLTKTWSCDADSTPKHGASKRFIVRINQTALSSTNPQCVILSGNCP